MFYIPFLCNKMGKDEKMEIKIVSFNIRGDWENDGVNSFIHRFGGMIEKILTENPDVIGFQEVTDPIIAFMKRALPEYEFVGQGRYKDYKGEGLYTAIKKDTFDVIGFETFWMSETPYIPESRYKNQSDCPRICVAARIMHKTTGEQMRALNIHLDHISDEARILGMDCVLGYLNDVNAKINLPYVILGDFNAKPDSKTIENCDNFDGMTRTTKDVTNTFHNFGRGDEMTIDYIYMSNGLAQRVTKTGKWTDRKNGIYLSDHYPIFADVKL